MHRKGSAIPLLVLLGTMVLGGCNPPGRRFEIAVDVPTAGRLEAGQIGPVYGTLAFVYRRDEPGHDHPASIHTDLSMPSHEAVDDANLLIFAEGSGDQPDDFRHTARLLAESRQRPPSGKPDLLIVLVHWSQSTNTVREHLNYAGQANGTAMLRRMCAVHRKRYPKGDGFVGIIGFSAGTRVTQVAFGAVLPQGRPGDKPPTLGPVPDEMKDVDNVVHLGSSINRDDPLPFGPIHGRFINFINFRDTHYGDRAPYFAPAGTSPVLLRVVEANLKLVRPRTGASANGFSRLPTLTSAEQFELLKIDKRLDEAFKMVNVAVPPELIPWSLLGGPIYDDDMDDYLNLAPNHYSMVGRGPAGAIASDAFNQYKDQSYEFVQEEVASAAMRGIVYHFHLARKPTPHLLPSLIDPLRLMLPGLGSEPPPELPPAPTTQPR